MPNDKKDAPKPIEKERIHVTVTPEKGKDAQDAARKKEYSQKVKDRLKEEVRKAVSDNKGAGAEKQLDAAKQKTEDAGQQVSREAVKEIKVKVEGESGGKPISKEVTVEPKEGAKPPPQQGPKK